MQPVPQFRRLAAHGRVVPHRHRHMLQHLMQFLHHPPAAAGRHRRAEDHAQGLIMEAFAAGRAELLQVPQLAVRTIRAAHMHHRVAHPDHGHAEAVEGVAQGVDDKGHVIQQDADPAVAAVRILQPHHGPGLATGVQHLPSLQQHREQFLGRGLLQFRIRDGDEVLPGQHLHGGGPGRLESAVDEAVEGEQRLLGGMHNVHKEDACCRTALNRLQ